MEVSSYNLTNVQDQQNSIFTDKATTGRPPLPRGFKPRPFIPTPWHAAQQTNDPSRFEISKPSSPQLSADAPIPFSHKSFDSLLSHEADTKSGESTSFSPKIDSPQKLSPLPIPLETFKEDVTLCTIDQIFSLKDTHAEEQFLIENASISQHIPTILLVKRAFFDPSQEGKLENLLEIFCGIESIDLAQALSYFLLSYRKKPQYQPIVATIQKSIEKKILKDLLLKHISPALFSQEDHDKLDAQIKDPLCSFEKFQDYVSFYIIEHIFSLESKAAEKSFLQVATSNPFLALYEPFLRTVLCYKHICANTPSNDLSQNLIDFFINSENLETLLQIFNHMQKTHQHVFDPDLLKELKIITQKRQLQEKIEEWIGKAHVDIATKKHSQHPLLSKNTSWDNFQETLSKAVLEHIFHLTSLTPDLEKIIQSLAFDEEYKNTILICFDTLLTFSTTRPSQIPERLVEIFKKILYPDCLQKAALFLEEIDTISQDPIQKLKEVASKITLLERSYEHLDTTLISTDDQEALKRATYDPQVDLSDFKELLTLYTIRQIFSRNRSRDFSSCDPLHSHITFIKNALESLVPETDLSYIASKLKKPELFLQIAHYLFMQGDLENHDKLLQFIQSQFPIVDVTTRYKPCFSQEKKEWALEPEQSPSLSSDSPSFYSLPQHVWDLLQTHQIDLAAKELEKQENIWKTIAPLLAQRHFSAIYELVNESGHISNWKDTGVRFFLLLGRPDLALKIPQSSKFHYPIQERAEKFALIIQNIITHPNLGYLFKIETLNKLIQSLSSWEYDPWKEFFSLQLINDFGQQALDLASTIKQMFYKDSFYESLLAQNHFLNAWQFLNQDRKILKKHQEQLAIDQTSLEYKKIELRRTERILKPDLSLLRQSREELTEYQKILNKDVEGSFDRKQIEDKASIQEQKVQSLEEKCSLFYSLQKSFDITEKNIRSLQENIHLLQERIQVLQRKSEISLAKCEYVNHIIQTLIKIHLINDPDASNFCDNVLNIAIQFWIEEAPNNPKKIHQQLNKFQQALLGSNCSFLRSFACKALCKAHPSQDLKTRPFYEALIAIAKTIEHPVEKQDLYDFCLAENNFNIVLALINEEPLEACKQSTCIKLLKKRRIDEALSVFRTIKHLRNYEETAKRFIDTLLPWNVEGTKELFNEALQKMLSILKSAHSTALSDAVKQNICLDWLHKKILQKEMLELMDTIKNPTCRLKIESALTAQQS